MHNPGAENYIWTFLLKTDVKTVELLRKKVSKIADLFSK